MDFVVDEFQLPVVTVNYEQLEAELRKRLADYRGLVVTDDTLAACKDAQKELAGLRIKIDAFRKEKKKELSAPITEFENKCKNLISYIEEAELPLKAGIKVYDDAKREEKRAEVELMTAAVAAEAGLSGKYAVQLTVLDKYLNLTATKKGIREDLEVRAFALKVEQDREQERITILTDVINNENSRLRTKLRLDEFAYLIDGGMETTGIIKRIQEQAGRIYAAENSRPEEPSDEEMPGELQGAGPVKEEMPEIPPEAPEAGQEKLYTMTVKLTGTLVQIRAVSTRIKEVGISYVVTDQREV